MGAPRIRVEYDNLTQIAKTFMKQGEATKSTSNRLVRQVDVLHGGHWIGRGADTFYQEMESSILPSLNGLAEALAMADRVSRGIIKIMHETEEDAASLIQVFEMGGLISAVSVSGMAAGGGGIGAAGVSQWSEINKLLVRDPSSLFSPSKLRGLINLQIQGAGAELGAAMSGLLSNPSKSKTDSLIAIIIILRGRPEAEIRIEFEQFQEAMEQRDAANAETPPSTGSGGNSEFMGSMTQMRYGSVVGDAFGIDPTFGAMLNPTGGLIGPGNWAFAGADTAVGYHQISHDAGGYLQNNHQIGPGYDYLGSGTGSPSDPSTGHSAGISFWRQALGGSTISSTQGSLAMGGQVGGINKISQSLVRVENIY